MLQHKNEGQGKEVKTRPSGAKNGSEISTNKTNYPRKWLQCVKKNPAISRARTSDRA
jgi:hypothetical protein